MPDVYIVQTNGKSEPMTAIPAKSELKDLQDLLELNPRLLPGDQIDPDEPRRWMAVKKEMPVPDTETGAARWNIDFLFVDQDAMPTFVECKRYEDTRARREVVGQVLEYVANAKHFWTAGDLQTHAESTCKSREALEDAVRQLQSEYDSPEALFAEAEAQLKRGEVRIVFFMEQAPVELKRLVEFMNTHMDTVEVLLVEARLYATGALKVVVPTLFGFTERIREIKRATAAASQPSAKPVATDWDSFRVNATQKGVGEQGINAMLELFKVCEQLKADIRWGRGSVLGSFSPRWAHIAKNAAPFSVHANADLGFHFPAMDTEIGRAFSVELVKQMRQRGLFLPEDVLTQWYSLKATDWVTKVDALNAAIQQSFAHFPTDLASSL